ncbi:DUF1566 domain-containing protein [Ectothiorhodospira sp. BSL-9]|uniref:DUF1566 domain-containing protein n=1 Tax=Ectothiorhodospira sp. BSL-9 TaxID=1442136 RepID=UPI0007B45235|nr:DUF1566 domain-containing protein [Ectothiorhodospira sp. BSL-9]ANB01759.1 hypothetical protein ECTOBSL9_0941 [Ectothiorhodospira sp. BSL-9]
MPHSIMSAAWNTLITVLTLVLVTVAVPAQATPELSIENYELVSSNRISRFEFEYTYSAEVTNTGADALDVAATLSVEAPGVTVQEGALSFGDVPTGTSAPSSDTFKILHDRRHRFGVDDLTWSFTFQPSIYSVSAIAGEGGAISPSSHELSPGDIAVFSVTPDLGYVIDTVHGCGGTLDATLFTTAPVTTACTVTAEFTRDDRPIQLSAPVVEGALLPGSTADLSPGVRYSGDGFLEFSLVESPLGMTVNARTGHLRWTPTDEHAGQTFTVQLSAADSETSSLVVFSVRVAQPTVVATTSEVLDDGRIRITVTDTDLALDGLEVFLPEDFTASDYVTSVTDGIPDITLINPSDVPSPDSFSPETDILLTEFFRIDPVSIGTDYIGVLLPPVELPAGRYSEELMLYVYERPVGISAAQGPIWTAVTHGLRVTEDGRALIMIAATGQPMVVGISAVIAAAAESTSGAFWYRLATPVAGRETVPIECESDSSWIDLQLCTVEFPRQLGACSLDGLTDCKAKIRIRDFSENNWTNPPPDFSVHHVAGWAADALVKFNTLGLPFDAWTDALISTRDANIEVKIRDISRLRNPCRYTALVKPVNNYRVLHLNAFNTCARESSVQRMKSALVHEYFHHAQTRVEERLYPLFDWRSTVVSDEVREWLYEGTAVWFQDEVYDHHNYYVRYGILRILDRGLASNTQPADAFGFGVPVPENMVVSRGYDHGPFFKLLQRRGNDEYGCDFTATNSDERNFLAEIFTGHSSKDDGAGRLLDAISDPSFSCGFGSVFGADNRMANALEHYTYATQIKQDIRLLDRSEPSDFDDWTFDGEIYPRLVPWGREESVSSEPGVTHSLNLAPLSSIVVRLEDQHGDLGRRALSVRKATDGHEGTTAFVSLRNSEGEDPKPDFVTNDGMKMYGDESWNGWFLTFVNADPGQRKEVLFDIFLEIEIRALDADSCTEYGLCGFEVVFAPKTDFSDTYVEIDWGNGALLSRVSVQDCIASGVCRDQGDGRIRVWGSYADPGSFGASLSYAFGEGAWQTVPAEFSVTAVNALPLDATPGDHSVTLDWPALPADEYNLCRSETSVSHLDNCYSEGGEHVEGDIGMPPHLVSGLANAQEYFFRLEGRFGDRRIYSNEATATPTEAGVGLPGTHPLNDTGIDWCADGGANFLGCPVAGYPGQDGEFGRDAAAREGTLEKVGAGDAGFDYTKIANDGAELPASATLGSGPNEWACTRDNVTGLIWEVKTTDGGLRDRDNTYTWYQPAGPNMGDPGTQDGGRCEGSACDTTGFVQAVNVQGLCGTTDWRLPTLGELLSIVHHGGDNLPVDANFFPNTVPRRFWSASPYAGRSGDAWAVNQDVREILLDRGYTRTQSSLWPSPARLVSGAD